MYDVNELKMFREEHALRVAQICLRILYLSRFAAIRPAQKLDEVQGAKMNEYALKERTSSEGKPLFFLDLSHSLSRLCRLIKESCCKK
jgi:hypothetical protein